MKPQTDNTTRRDLPTRCRHVECIAMRAEEFAAMGMTRLAVEVHKSDLPVRCRKSNPK